MYGWNFSSIKKKHFKRADINNSLVKLNLETNRYFDFKDSKMLIYIHYKKRRKIIEFWIISNL